MTGSKDHLLAAWRRHLEPRVGPALVALDARTGSRMHRCADGPVPWVLYCVYRRRNADTVRRLVEHRPPGSRVVLHALDESAPELAAWTASHGPGRRMPLLQSLVDRDPPLDGEWVVVADDDAVFVGGQVGAFVRLAAAGALDIAQPAHVHDSIHSFRVTRAVPLSTVRETRFVEVGPVVAFSPGVRHRVLPFPSDARMGWGLDVAWTLVRRDGFRLGVVDATPVRHHGAVAAEYDDADEYTFQERYLAEAGVESSHELATNTGRTWRPWQRQPRWVGERR
ncbi:hypothetical protein JQN72_08660 [Phycicoccus sp. CSK15P-2]|uniref:hypothetical protein n=1 Tax=Phycicoccus sp. CSK15P-2 TaxID=2807627 RepID=UPI00194FDDAC|nr:hypothetical protein [Phycicoccus sp. CSK15P-2]MBM6404309.1 hypothetical protein [Phycicoccus sp. CSK15P-2]